MFHLRAQSAPVTAVAAVVTWPGLEPIRQNRNIDGRKIVVSMPQNVYNLPNNSLAMRRLPAKGWPVVL